MSEFLDMDGHGAYVWPAYILTALVLGALVAATLVTLRRREREVERLMRERETRGRRGAGDKETAQ